MSRKIVIFSTILLASLFFVVGWFGYEWMIQFVTAEMRQSLSVASLQDALNHRLITSASLACAGVAVGFGGLISSRSTVLNNNTRLLILLALAAILAMYGWMVMLAGRMSELSQNLSSTSVVPEASLSITSIPLYEIGLVGSGCTLVIVLALVILSKKDQ